MATQRKIYHLLQSEGEGKTFRYIFQLFSLINLKRPVLVTEKVDGSTMQSFRGEPYKRFDKFKKGDPAKRLVSEEDRYELRKLDPNDPANKWYLESFSAYKREFEEFGETYPNHWIYFEALGEKINNRYKGLEPTIRVFDTSYMEKFCSFVTTIDIAKEFRFPLVACRYETFGSLDNLIEILSKDTSRDVGFPEHQLEGYVLRQNNGITGEEIIAKIRVEDLKRLVRQKNF